MSLKTYYIEYILQLKVVSMGKNMCIKVLMVLLGVCMCERGDVNMV